MSPIHTSSNFPVFFALLSLIAGLMIVQPSEAADNDRATVTIKLGDYRFSPDQVELVAGQPVRLVLVNTDGVTPHNFTLKDETGKLSLDINVAAGKTRELDFVPQVPGAYLFFCKKKLPFMKSHRDRGMQGSLDVTAGK